MDDENLQREIQELVRSFGPAEYMKITAKVLQLGPEKCLLKLPRIDFDEHFGEWRGTDDPWLSIFQIRMLATFLLRES